MSRLFYERPEKYGLGLREERLFDACLALRSAADLLSEEGRPCRMAYDELRQLCDAEFRTVRMMARSRLPPQTADRRSSAVVGAGPRCSVKRSLEESWRAGMCWRLGSRPPDPLGRSPGLGPRALLRQEGLCRAMCVR